MATTSSPSSVTCSLLRPCKRALARLFRIGAFRFRSLRSAAGKMSYRRTRPRRRTFQSVSAVFWPLVPMPGVSHSELVRTTSAVAEALHAPFPSPETPAYVKAARLPSLRSDGGGAEEEACGSFERRLMEMLVEERKVKDLQDVEELLQCWERLKSPVFVELVCRFYGEMCKDLFPGHGQDEVSLSVPSSSTV